MNVRLLLLLVLVFYSCSSSKMGKGKTASVEKDMAPFVKAEPGFEVEVADTVCYAKGDTAEYIVFYMPLEETFFVNNYESEVEEICQRIEHGMSLNRGVKFYYEPGSKFSILHKVLNKVKECFSTKLDEMSFGEYGVTYESLLPEQKAIIDERLSYRVIGEE